jgi:Mn-dependent DtxR family transcriptional regulator
MTGKDIEKKKDDLRLRILEYMEGKPLVSFFDMAKDLQLYTATLAAELKILVETGSLAMYSGPSYSLTPEGLRELNQLRRSRVK